MTDRKVSAEEMVEALDEMAGVCYSEGIGFDSDTPEVKAIRAALLDHERLRQFIEELKCLEKFADAAAGMMLKDKLRDFGEKKEKP